MNKSINIMPEKIPESGDCYGICISKLFEYYKKDGFEKILHQIYPIILDNHGKIDGVKQVELFRKVHTGRINYHDALVNEFSLDFSSIYFLTNIDIIKYHIDNGRPVIITLSGLLVPWTNVTREGGHSFIIVGYNQESQTFTCVDPYFCDKHVDLDFKIIPEACMQMNFANMEVWDFGVFKEANTFNNLKDEMSNFMSLLSGSPASKILREINSIIEYNSQYYTSENFGAYILDNESLLKFSSRYACLSSYFKYLHKKYHATWLLEVYKIYQNCFNSVELCMSLFLKYRFGSGDSNLKKLLDNIFDLATSEGQVEFLCTNNSK